MTSLFLRLTHKDSNEPFISIFKPDFDDAYGHTEIAIFLQNA